MRDGSGSAGSVTIPTRAAVLAAVLVLLALLSGPGRAQQEPGSGPSPPLVQAPVPMMGGVAKRPAEKVVAGLSQKLVSITANFDGSEILVFGAVKRITPPPPGALRVAITVEGPRQAVTVRRKSRVAGIWVNTNSAEITEAPSFYAVATSAPWEQVLSPQEDARWRISVEEAVGHAGAEETARPAFAEALVRVREEAGLYLTLPETVRLKESTLFSTSVRLPANLVEGNYRVRIFLTRDGRVVDSYLAHIGVQRAGLERWLYRLSLERPLIYGLLAIAIAILAGWAASGLFRLVWN